MREGKRADAVIVLAFLTVSLCLFLLKYGQVGTKVAKVYQDGKLTHVIELDDTDEKVQVKINGSVLAIENGEIYYLSSDCPDKLCEKFGHLSQNGDTASCVPNKTVVTVEENNVSETADVITY